jgi:hypothetical protein
MTLLTLQLLVRYLASFTNSFAADNNLLVPFVIWRNNTFLGEEDVKEEFGSKRSSFPRLDDRNNGSRQDAIRLVLCTKKRPNFFHRQHQRAEYAVPHNPITAHSLFSNWLHSRPTCYKSIQMIQ